MCVNGKAFVGTLATAVAAGIVIAKIADAALCTCNKCKTLEDDFCAGFCKELLISQDLVESAAAKQNRCCAEVAQLVFPGVGRQELLGDSRLHGFCSSSGDDSWSMAGSLESNGNAAEIWIGRNLFVSDLCRADHLRI